MKKRLPVWLFCGNNICYVIGYDAVSAIADVVVKRKKDPVTNGPLKRW